MMITVGFQYLTLKQEYFVEFSSTSHSLKMGKNWHGACAYLEQWQLIRTYNNEDEHDSGV
jgi:hypothetical protein